MTKSELAQQYFKSGANCAQAVLAAFAEETGLTVEAATRLASGFGGGIARMRSVCGTVSGMIMAADAICASGDMTDKNAKDRQYQLVRSLVDEFVRLNGSYICGELLGLAQAAPEASTVSETRTPEYFRKRPCVELVGQAAEILEKALAARKTSTK